MSSRVVIALVLVLMCTVASLIIAIPLQTAGYENHVKKNEALVPTQCRVKDWIISPATCYRNCMCYNQCNPTCMTRTTNGVSTTTCGQTCHQQCSLCPYTCYTAGWLVEYSITVGSPDFHWEDLNATMQIKNGNETMMANEFMHLSVVLNAGVISYDSTSLANYALSQRPINSEFPCYYDSTNLGDLELHKYDVYGFFASFITFYVFAGIGALLLYVLLFAYYCTRSSY